MMGMQPGRDKVIQHSSVTIQNLNSIKRCSPLIVLGKRVFVLRIPFGIHDASFSNAMECAPAVTNLHTTNSHAVALSTSLCSPEIDIRKGQRQSRQSCHRTAFAYLWQLLESSPDILNPDQDGYPPTEDRSTTSRLGLRTVGAVDLSANSCCTFLPLSSWHCTELWHCISVKVGRTGNTQDTCKCPRFSLIKILISTVVPIYLFTIAL